MPWFPTEKNKPEGWRLDIVSLLAVIGESSMESHGQALTSSWTCMLPRIIPAPQALLKPTRPTRLPQINAGVVGVHNGTLVSTLNYFPNILHPVEELPAFAFKVYTIKHKGENHDGSASEPTSPVDPKAEPSRSTSIEMEQIERGSTTTTPTVQRRSTFRKMTQKVSSRLTPKKPRVPSKRSSPLNILSILSFFLTIGLLVWAILIEDGTACVALATISVASSVIGYASWWSPLLSNRIFSSRVPPGDVVIRTREGAFIVVQCNESVSRELYFGTEECVYYVRNDNHRLYVGLGTFLLMISVVLLGNCNFTMQAAIGISYVALNGAFWATAIVNKKRFWDLSLYELRDVTPDDARAAEHAQDPASLEGEPSYTRSLWYAIRETRKVGWVRRAGAAPSTPQWETWLRAAELAACQGRRDWPAVQERERIIGMPAHHAHAPHKDVAEQYAPVLEIPSPTSR